MPHRSTRQRYEEMVAAARRKRAARRADATKPRGDLPTGQRPGLVDSGAPRASAEARQAARDVQARIARLDPAADDFVAQLASFRVYLERLVSDPDRASAAPHATAPAPPAPTSGDELRAPITEHIGGGPPAQFELKKMLGGLGITSLEGLVEVSTGGPVGMTPGAYLRELLVEQADPRRKSHVPPAEALDKLIQAARDKTNK